MIGVNRYKQLFIYWTYNMYVYCYQRLKYIRTGKWLDHRIEKMLKKAPLHIRRNSSNRMGIVLLTLTLGGEGVSSFLPLARFNQNHAKHTMCTDCKYTNAVILILWVCLKWQWHNTVLSISGVLLKIVPPTVGPFRFCVDIRDLHKKSMILPLQNAAWSQTLLLFFWQSQLQIPPYSISANLNSNLKF